VKTKEINKLEKGIQLLIKEYKNHLKMTLNKQNQPTQTRYFIHPKILHQTLSTLWQRLQIQTDLKQFLLKVI